VIAVLRSLALSRTERLLQAMIGETKDDLLLFEDQPQGGSGSVPDARISAAFRIDVETKTSRGCVDANQLNNHLEGLRTDSRSNKWLILLTPDREEPEVLRNLRDAPIIWRSFSDLDSAIEELLEDPQEVISEREAFLLRELQQMFEAERLLEPEHDVLVVPARSAWPEYKQYHAYICQPSRTFQDVKYLAFYADGEIKRHVPKINAIQDETVLDPGRIKDSAFRHVVEKLLQDDARTYGASNKILLLSAPDSKDTVVLENAVRNDLQSQKGSGRVVAFTQNQRYVSMEKLRKAKTTSEVVCVM
jgi:hypothetical protein